MKFLRMSLLQAMVLVGEKMTSGEMFIPEMLMTARAMQAAVEVLKPRLSAGSPAVLAGLL